MILDFLYQCGLKAGKWLLPSSAFIYVFSMFLPWVSGPRGGPDNSWGLTLHWAFERHLQFGRDIVFTFGPWGVLYGNYYPSTFPICAAMWTMLAFIFWWAGWRLACHCSANRLGAWLCFLVFAGTAGLRIEQSVDVRMVAWCLLLLFLHFFVEDVSISARQVLLVISLGLLGLVKATGFTEAAMVVTVIAADDIFRRRSIPWVLFLFAASTLFFWIVAGQRLDSIWPFVHYSQLLAGGYTEAMMWATPGEIIRIGGFLASAAALIALTGYVAWGKRGFYGMFPVIGLCAILFLIFKHSYVRYDLTHGVASAMQLLFAAAACLAVVWPVLREKKWRGWAICVVAGAGILFFCSFAYSRCYRDNGLAEEGLLTDLARTLKVKNVLWPAKWFRDPEFLQKAYEDNLAQVRSAFPVPPMEGSVDVYPWNAAALFAHHLQYAPRPVLQSYSAYTPELAELNAAHLRSDDAPRNILFNIAPIDNNFPALEDGRSWPELLSRYDEKGSAGKFVFLKRSSRPRQYRLTPVTNMPVRLGESVAIAAHDGPIWAEMDINKTPWGSIVSTLFRPPALELKVCLRNGRQTCYHLVPGMARGGFLLSPLIENDASFVSLASADGWRQLADLHVINFTIFADTSSGSTACYQSPMRLRLSRLDVQDGIPANRPPSKLRAAQTK